MDDRAPRRERAMARMRDALAQLARLEVLGDGFDAAVRAVLETSAEALDVRRAGYWVLEEGPSRLHLLDLYDAADRTHTSGVVLSELLCPPYFAALGTGRVLAIDDARADPRSSGLGPEYLGPFGVTSLLDAPVFGAGRVAGVVCHEQVGGTRRWTPDERQFAQTVANLLSMAGEIRERRAAERELARTRGALERLVALLPLALIRVDADDRVVTWSRAAELLFGWPAEEVVGRPLPTVPTADLAAFHANLAAARRGERPAFEAARLRKDGTLVPVEVWAGPDGAGGVTALFADLTARREAERALGASEARWRTLVANAPAVIAVTDREGRITFLNRAVDGGAPETAIGRSLREVMPEPDGDHVLGEAVASGKPGSYDVAIVARDGARRWFRTVLGPVVDDDGTVEAVIAVATDTTELAEAQRAVVRERDRARAYLDVAGVMLVALDADGRVTMINRRGCQYVGRTEREVVGAAWIDAFVEVGARPRVREAFERMLASGEAVDLEYTVTGADADRCLSFKHALLRDRRGRAVGLLASGDDVTARRRAERALAQHKDHLEAVVEARTAELTAVNRELEAFAYSVSHDLRAPLRSIDGFGEALLQDYGAGMDDTARDWLRRICDASARMNHLIDGLLTLSRATRGQVADEVVDLRAVALSVIADLRRGEPERRVEVRVADPMMARGDPTLLRTVMENLVGNAWKFSSKRPEAHIEIGVGERDGERCWFVRDDGAGFDPAHADRLFTVFQRLHTSAEFEGSGIGLATVQRIVHRHGGRVGAEGAVGKGATFWFTLGAR